METPWIKEDLNFRIDLSQSQGCFTALSNGIDQKQFKVSDIEMVAIHSLTYTSLRDLLPTTSYSRGDSWREIQIKDPLVKHAAWAYLQPMTTAPESDDLNCFLKLKDGCCGVFGCFGWFLDDVVFRTIKRWFTEVEEVGNGGQDDPDKVD